MRGPVTLDASRLEGLDLYHIHRLSEGAALYPHVAAKGEPETKQIVAARTGLPSLLASARLCQGRRETTVRCEDK